jgi:hypothetical protein
MADLFLAFWGASTLFSIVVVLNYLLTNTTLYEGSFSPHPFQHLIFFVFLMVAILTRVWWDFNIILIYISFMTRDVEHFFMCFLVIWTTSFQKSSVSVHLPISSLAHSLIFGSLAFFFFILGLHCTSFYFILLFICAYKAWVISPPCPNPLPYHPLPPPCPPPTPSIPSRNYFALISNFVVERV